MENRPRYKFNIIFISGKIGTGKDTIADYIVRNYDNFTKMSFANHLKKIAKNGFGWDLTKDDRGRKLLQGLGNIGREYNEDIWVDKLADDIYETIDFINIKSHSNIDNIFHNIVIPDFRFPNEAKLVDKLVAKNKDRIDIVNNFSIRITGNNYSDRSDSSDISETSFDNYDFFFDYTIDNRGKTIPEVLDCVDEIMKEKNFDKNNLIMQNYFNSF